MANETTTRIKIPMGNKNILDKYISGTRRQEGSRLNDDGEWEDAEWDVNLINPLDLVDDDYYDNPIMIGENNTFIARFGGLKHWPMDYDAYDSEDENATVLCFESGNGIHPGILIKISKMFPNDEIQINIWVECGGEDEIIMKNGEVISERTCDDDEDYCDNEYESDDIEEIDIEDLDIHYDMLAEKEEFANLYSEEMARQKYEAAMELAESGKYEEAIHGLKEVIDSDNKYHDDALNNMGVCLQRLGRYAEAAEAYRACDTNIAKENLVAMFDNKQLDFTVEEYIENCEIMQKRNFQMGFLMLSWLYQNNDKGVENPQKAYSVLLEGLEKCEKAERIVFEIAYLLDNGKCVEMDNHKSHLCYESLVNAENIKAETKEVAQYNYAWQCRKGRGCEKDIEKAIKYFEMSAATGYVDAIKVLIDIYRGAEEGYMDEEKAQNWQKKLEELN